MSPCYFYPLPFPVGDDAFGRDHVATFDRENIDRRLVVVSKSAPTGMAHINVDDSGARNCVISSGANSRLGVKEVFGAAPSHLTGSKVLLVGLEIPPEVALYALKLGADHEMTTILTPTCAVLDLKFDDELYSNCDWFIPNRRCAASLFPVPPTPSPTPSPIMPRHPPRQLQLPQQQHHYHHQHHHLLEPTSSCSSLSSASTSTAVGTPCESVEDAKAMAKKLRQRGCKNVIITVGASGVVFLSQHSKVAIHIPAPPIDQSSVVDASGAADAFAGSFAYFLTKLDAEKLGDVENVYEVISKSCAVATFSVQRAGTMSSFPSQADIKLSDFL